MSRDGQPMMDDVLAATIKECKKENVQYRIEALRCTAAILDVYEIDRFKDFSEILFPVLQQVSLVYSS